EGPETVRHRRRALGALLGAAALAAAAYPIVHRLRSHPEAGVSTAARAAAPLRRSIAILGFKNLSARPQAAWLSTALSEMLTTELAAGQHLRMCAGEQIARTKLELQLGESDSLGEATLSRLRTKLGADDVVLGSYLVLEDEKGPQLRLDLRVQDTQSGE